MRRTGIAALALVGALAAPASAGAVEFRGETSTGHPIMLDIEGSKVLRYEVQVPAYCFKKSRRGVLRRKRTVTFTDARGAEVGPDGWFFARGGPGRLKAEIGGRLGEGGDAMGRFKLRPFKSGRSRCISPRVNWGAAPPFQG